MFMHDIRHNTDGTTKFNHFQSLYTVSMVSKGKYLGHSLNHVGCEGDAGLKPHEGDKKR